MSTKQINAKQSRKARSLLKWNVHDVISKCAIRVQRFDNFERGSIRLTRPENDELVKLYSDQGIRFTGNHDVVLRKDDVRAQRSKTKQERDNIDDINLLQELEQETNQEKEEELDANIETAKDFSERVQRLVNLKEDEDDENF